MGCMLAGMERWSSREAQHGLRDAERAHGRKHDDSSRKRWRRSTWLTHLPLTVWPIRSSVVRTLLFLHPLPPPSPVCRFLFFPLSLQLQSWQIAFTLLHFRIIARSCHPEKVTIPTALRFNSSVSSVTDSINGKNGPKDDAKKEKLQMCRWMPFPSDPTVTPGEVLLFYAALLPSKKPCW